jgi:hypothetical protein
VAALHGLADQRLDVAEAGHPAGGVCDGAGQRGETDRARGVEVARHAGGALDLDVSGALPSTSRRDEHVEDVQASAPQVVPADGDGSGDHALRAGVQQGGRMALIRAGRPGHGEIHPRQDLPPGAIWPEPVFDGAARHAALERLASRADFVLDPQYARQALAVISGESWHRRNMSPGSDKRLYSILVDGPLYQ